MTQQSQCWAYTPRKPELKDTCTPMFIAALFTIARTWKQPRCPLADKWIRKFWYIYTIEYYSAKKRIHLSLFLCMVLESVLLSFFSWPSSKSLQTINAGESIEKREPSYTVGGNANWYSHYGEQYGDSLKKLKIEPPYDPAISLLGICIEETRFERDTCTPVFTAACQVSDHTIVVI